MSEYIEGADGCGQHRERIKVEFDDFRDLVTIEGVRYSQDVFRAFAPAGIGAGGALRIEKRDPDGVVHVRTLREREPGVYVAD